MPRRQSEPTPDNCTGLPSPTPDEVDEIIARAQRQKAEADEERRRERAEARRRDALLNDLLTARAWGRSRPESSPATEAANWVGLLDTLLTRAAPYLQCNIVGRLAAARHGHTRQVLVRVCGLVRDKQWEEARRVLGAALDSALSPALWEDLGGQLPDDIAGLLPEALQAMVRQQRDWTAREGATLPWQQEQTTPAPDSTPVLAAQVSHAQSDAPPPIGPLGITLDLREWQATRNGVTASFAGKEYPWRIFQQLCRSYPASLPPDELVDAVWGKGEGSKDTMQAHMTTVRDIIKPLALTVRSTRKVGYKLADRAADPALG
jgi:hypothetical protein